MIIEKNLQKDYEIAVPAERARVPSRGDQLAGK